MKTSRTKTFTLILIILLIIINSGLLLSYYNFYVTEKFSLDLVEYRDTNHEYLIDILSNIHGKNMYDSILYLKKYLKKNGGFVSLKTKDGVELYSNKKDVNKLFSSTSFIIIEGEEFELTYSKIDETPGIKFIKNLIIYEIFLMSILSISIFIINSWQLINPMETIIEDINNYKYGVIPKKRKMPYNMESIQNTFVDMVDSLEIEKEYQNQIIASISHDIKTPLTSVIGYADRLKNKKLPKEKQEKYEEKIYSKAILMKEILEEFDDYQSCNIKETLKLEKINIQKIADEIDKNFKDELIDKNIELTVKNNCKKTEILIDFIKIKRIFSNVITNSVTHFNGKKGKINISFNNSHDKVEVIIADDGGGIEEEKNLKRIFEPLYTTDPSRKISGLGLAICKQIIKAHDGNIYAINNDIGGLSVIFEIKKSNFNNF